MAKATEKPILATVRFSINRRFGDVPREVLEYISEFADAPSPARIIKFMSRSWCQWYTKKTDSAFIEDPAFAQQFWRLGLPQLTKYNKIDEFVLLYCLGSYIHSMSKSAELDPEDFRVILKVGASGNLKLIHWILSHHISSRFNEFVTGMYVGAYESLNFRAMEALQRSRQGNDAKFQRDLFMATEANSVERVMSIEEHSEWIYALERVFGRNVYDDLTQVRKSWLNSLTFEEVAVTVSCAHRKIVGTNWRRQAFPYIPPGDDNQETIDWVINYETNAKTHALISDMADEAAAIGNLDILKWFYAKGLRCTHAGFDKAALNGKLDILRWLYKQNERGSFYAAENAAAMGHLTVVKWLFKKRLIEKKNVIYAKKLALLLERYNVLYFLVRCFPYKRQIEHVFTKGDDSELDNSDQNSRPWQRRRLS